MSASSRLLAGGRRGAERLAGSGAKGLKINADDVINNAIFIVSSKLKNPQFSGQTKERLDSKDHSLLKKSASLAR